MNKQTEALKMAIDELMNALKLLQRFEPQIVGGDMTAWTVGLRNQLSDLQHTMYNNGLVEAIQACKEALAQPARLVSYAPDKSTCTLNIDGEEVYFNRAVHIERSADDESTIA